MSDTDTILEEFIEKLLSIEKEKALLVEDRKILVSDYRDKLDVKTVQAAIRIAKIKSKLESSDEEIENIVNVAERNITV